MDHDKLTIESCLDILSPNFDCVVLVTDSLSKLVGPLQPFYPILEARKEIDKQVEIEPSLLSVDDLPGHRLIFSPTGPLNRDYDDVRRFQDAAEKGIKRAIKAGCIAPLLVRAPDHSFVKADLVTLLGALHAIYVPLELREFSRKSFPLVKMLGFWGMKDHEVKRTIFIATALESGRFVCRDIGGSDPERMAPPHVANYVHSVFNDSPVLVEIISDESIIQRKFPLLHAVNRAARGIPRHQARVVLLTYVGEGAIDTTLMMVGKGVTYDTGGADVKTGGHMAGMHRDKCGAAAVAGFFQLLAKLKPTGLKAIGALAMVRNSIGSDAYVADEIITCRSGQRIRIGNTDAEGRMAMADLLCYMKDKAVNEVNPHLFTIATLTGHACLAVGEGYSIAIDNGPARVVRSAHMLQETGENVGEPFEVSTLRREDYEMNSAKSVYEDLLQCNNAPSSQTARGHQFPAAFLIQTSGLDKHGLNSTKPIKYTHLDIAAASGPFPGVPSGAPVVALAAHFVLPRI